MRTTEHPEEPLMLSVRLEPALEKRLNELAERTGRTKSYYVREAIVHYLEDMEDRYIAIERLENPAKHWTLDEAERELDLDSGD
jgi:RHH-type rel operon transcriptional repressor/antitoxin RelB